jgi:cytoskeleton protein RodZ
MTQDTLPTSDTHLPSSDTLTAGALLRQYRQAHDISTADLAVILRVSVAKLDALEQDHLDALPDAMFARALSLAICRQLNTDAAPVLALLPSQDTTSLAAKNERGLDFPLERPSFLPQSSFLVIERFFTPMRWAALVVLLVAGALAVWPDLHPWLVFKDDRATASESTVVVPVAVPGLSTVESVATPASPPETQVISGNTVLTTVQSQAVLNSAPDLAQTPAAATSVLGASNAQ